MRLPELPRGCTVGLNFNLMHDSAVAVVGPDGRVEFACSLERLTRVKQDGRWPERLLAELPEDAHMAYAVGSLDLDAARTLGAQFARTWGSRPKEPLPERDPFPYPSVWQERIDALPSPPRSYDHHLAHAASAYYPSGLEQALVITCDAGAHLCPWTFAAYRAEGDRIELVAGMHFRDHAVPAHLYTLVTCLLGLRPNRHEGKVTGLAARGRVRDGEQQRFEEIAWPLTEQLGRLLRWDMAVGTGHAPTCVVNEAVRCEWRQKFADYSDEQLAACAQGVLEDTVLSLVAEARECAGGGDDPVCLAGGVFANVLLNQKVIAGFRRGFVAPAMTDDGIALGAALLAHAERRPEASPRRHRCSMYLGPELEFDPSASHGLVSERVDDLADRVAEVLAEGKIVAVVRGRMEFGPRALGHRSVLAPAVDPTINDWLNRKLSRTEYMPFAPILLREEAPDLLQDFDRIADAARFMTVTAHATQALRDEAPALVHVDGTVRPQVVDAEDEDFCARVLRGYAARTGRRALINTSFNVHEEPIVCSAEDALRAFAQTGLDYLVLDDVLLRREGNESALEGHLQPAAASGGSADAGNLEPALALGRWLRGEVLHAAGLQEAVRVLESQAREAAQELERHESRFQELAAEIERLQAALQQSEDQRGQSDSLLQGARDDLAELERRIAAHDRQWLVRWIKSLRVG